MTVKKDHDNDEPRIGNRDQDPKHPANTTLSPARESAPRPAAEAFNVKPDDLKTEQEKGKPDPVSPSEPSPGPVKTIEEEGIGSRQPYPTKEG